MTTGVTENIPLPKKEHLKGVLPGTLVRFLCSLEQPCNAYEDESLVVYVGRVDSEWTGSTCGYVRFAGIILDTFIDDNDWSYWDTTRRGHSRLSSMRTVRVCAGGRTFWLHRNLVEQLRFAVKDDKT